MSLLDDAKLILIPSGYGDGKWYSYKGADFSFTQNTGNAWRFNRYGKLENVPANTPRITWVNGEPEILVEESQTNVNNYSLDVVAAGFNNPSNWTATNFASGGYGDLPYQLITINTASVSFKQLVTSSTVFSYRLFIRNITNLHVIAVYNNTTATTVAFMRYDSNYNIIQNVNGYGHIENTGDNGWHSIEVNVLAGINVGDTISYYLHNGNTLANESYEVCQMDAVEDTVAGTPIITNGAIATRNDDVATVTPPAGTTEIREYLPNGTYNSITTIPATYQIPNGRWQKIIML